MLMRLYPGHAEGRLRTRRTSCRCAGPVIHSSRITLALLTLRDLVNTHGRRPLARARLLKPGFFTNEGLLELPVEARLLFAGLWTIADRSGRLQDRPKRIKIELFPADAFDIDLMLHSLESHGFIHRYTTESQRLIHVVAFLKHQSPHPREVPSKLPACGCEAMDGAQTIGETPASPSVAVAVPIAVAGSSVAVAEADDAGEDPGFRDRYGTLTTAFGGRLDARLCDEFSQLAEEFSIEEITTAIRTCRSENVRPWPREVRARSEKPPVTDATEKFRNSRVLEAVNKWRAQ